MPKIKLSDCEIYCETHGKGTPLLFISGLAGTGSYWTPQINEFSHHFQVVIHDHRGTGQSTPSKIDYSVEQMAGDVVKLMDELGIEKAHVLGHSTGGAIAQVLAIENPERLLSMVIYASWTKADPFMERVMEMRKVLLLKGGSAAYVKGSHIFLYPHWWINDHAELLEQMDRQIESGMPSPDIVTSRIDAVLSFDRSDELNEIDTPALVICAKDDLTTPSYFSEIIAGSINNSKILLPEQGGHFLSHTMTENFNSDVLSFLLAQEKR